MTVSQTGPYRPAYWQHSYTHFATVRGRALTRTLARDYETMLPETAMGLACTPGLKRHDCRTLPTISLHHAFFDRVRGPPADGDDERLRFLTGMPVGPVAWTDAPMASSGASAIFSLASEAVLQMQLVFFGRLHLEQL